jgi:hypothetical protein
MTDETGAAQTGTGVFNFSVSTHADNALTVPYEINLTKVESTAQSGQAGYYDSMADNQVKALLLKDGTAVSETTSAGKLISQLTASQVSGRTAKILHSDQDVYTAENQATKTTNYTLKLWIEHSVNYTDVTGKEYHAKVNVDSHVNPVITSAQP